MISINILDFGAVPDSEKVQTKVFQDAIDACFLQGGGEVIVPEGVFVTGDIRLRSNITLHLLKNAVIKGSSDISDYSNILKDKIEPLPESEATDLRWIPSYIHMQNGGGLKKPLYTAGSYWNHGIIRAVYAENVSIIGEDGSVIDGGNLYDTEGEEGYRGPHGIDMHYCKNLRFEGYTIRNTGNWAHAIFQSENITYHNLTVLGGHDSLHTRASKNITITDCNLSSGDDCIAGFDCVDMVVKNCNISSSCSAFRLGGKNILIEDCTAYGPCEYQFRGAFTPEEKKACAPHSQVARNNMLCFFTYFVTDDLPHQAQPGNITIRNCRISGADRLLHINLSGNETWQRGNPPEDMTFENIKAENIKTGIFAYGDGIVNFKLTFKNIDYSIADGYETESLFKVANFGEINVFDTNIANFEGDTLITHWEQAGKVNINNLNCKYENLISKSATEFSCEPI